MPVTAGIGQADGPTVVIEDVRDHEDLGMGFQVVAIEYIAVERPEPFAELDLLIRRQVLVAEKDDAVVVVGGFNFGEHRIGDRL